MQKQRALFAAIATASFLTAVCHGEQNITATPPAAYTVGGIVSGLSGTGLVLRNNGGNELRVSANGEFRFPAGVSGGAAYNVTIHHQPSNPAQTCFVANGNGIAKANVKSIQVECSSQKSCVSVPAMTTASVTWVPQWCQEFDGPATLPDSRIWSFDLGNNKGWGNHEAQIYCGPPGYPGNPPECPTEFDLATNTVYLDGKGHLVIQPTRKGTRWLSTRITTKNTEDFRYGLIEARLQIPDTAKEGLWPAFWALGSDYPEVSWPDCGEVDIMENWPVRGQIQSGPKENRSTIHTDATGWGGTGQSYHFPGDSRADTAFHRYGSIWSANMMQFYVDDPSAPFFIITASDLPAGDRWPFNQSMFLILNVAVGGTLGGDESGLSAPSPMMADYVRQYTPIASHKPFDLVPGSQAPIIVNAGATATAKIVPALARDAGFVYFSCEVNAPKASCTIQTTNPLNAHVVDSRGAKDVAVTVTTSKETPSGDYEVRVYAFLETNAGDGLGSSADASIAIPLTIKKNATPSDASSTAPSAVSR